MTGTTNGSPSPHTGAAELMRAIAAVTNVCFANPGTTEMWLVSALDHINTGVSNCVLQMQGAKTLNVAVALWQQHLREAPCMTTIRQSFFSSDMHVHMDMVLLPCSETRAVPA